MQSRDRGPLDADSKGRSHSLTDRNSVSAKGPEKARAKEHLSRIAGYIMDNGWKIIDADGKPTRWERWDSDYLLVPPYGIYARG